MKKADTTKRAQEKRKGFTKKNFDYAKEISFEDTCDSVQCIMDSINSSLVTGKWR
ncbi:MAG: hypothetical protein NC392_14645 [Roseburia sp.]|nr:hypothetical protein [Roseburia sp.]